MMKMKTQLKGDEQRPFLPPISSLPNPTYPPSSYPSPSYFESQCVVRPALVLPAKRTGEAQKALGRDLVHREPKRKSVHPPELGVDYDAEDVGGGVYDSRQERKIILASLGAAVADCGMGHAKGEGGSGGEGLPANLRRDKVWSDPRVRSLLDSAIRVDEGEGESLKTAPPGRRSIRPSFIQLPATPYSLLSVDQVIRRIMPTADSATLEDSQGGCEAEPENSSTPTKTDENGPANNGNPAVEEIPSSFETAGHVAHVNLRDDSLPYKYLIGKAILDKNAPRIRVVVNKVGNIENEYRTFPMEIIAGEGMDAESVERLCAAAGATVRDMVSPQHRSLMEVEVREHGCRFRLDFARVYFNSRLQGEHDRLVRQIVAHAREGSRTDAMRTTVVADAMAGVGPFAVPLSSANAPHYHRTRIVCHANDLNPVSYEYLGVNARINRCFSDRLIAYNMDARRFIHKMNGDGVDVDHFIMNLPQTAIEFLDAFRGWKFSENEDCEKVTNDCEGTIMKKKKKKRPMIHVHCFGEKPASGGGAQEIARVEGLVRQRCERALACAEECLLDGANEFHVRVVRDVGPRKNMMCATFRLPEQAANAKRVVFPAAAGPADEGSEFIDDVGITGEKRVRSGHDRARCTELPSGKKGKES